MNYAVCLECTVPTGKKRWFEILVATTPDECKRSYEAMKEACPEAKYAMAIEGRHASYHNYIDSCVRKLFWKIANDNKIYDITYQAFVVEKILQNAIKCFEEKAWLIDTHIDFIDRMMMHYFCGLGGEADLETETLKWVSHFGHYIPLPQQAFYVPERHYMLHDATPDEFYYEDYGVRFETSLRCDVNGWFTVKNDPNGLFEPFVDSFIRENNLPSDTNIQILVNARTNECKVEKL